MKLKSFFIYFRERAWIGTYTSPELIYALRLGYQILEWFEGYIYEKEEHIFEDFMRTLASFKLRVSYKNHNILLFLIYVSLPVFFRASKRFAKH